MKDKSNDLSPHSEKFDKKEVREIPLDCIIPNRYQPRKTIEKESLQELIDSISTHGVLQPIVVRPDPKKPSIYEIIMGERRFRSCEALKKATIPAVVKPATDMQMMEWALIENTHRKDLNPIERAKAYQQLVETFHLTQEEVAKRVGADRATVSNFIRMLGLPPEIIEDVRSQRISVGHALAILALPDSNKRLMVWHRVRNEDLSVRNTRIVVDAYLHPRGVAVSSEARKFPMLKEFNAYNDEEIRELTRKLVEKFGSTVSIHVHKLDGKFISAVISLMIYSDDEYKHVVDIMNKS